MRYKLFNLEWDSSHKIAVMSMTCNVVLVIIVLLLAYSLSKKNERIVVVPTTVNKAFEIQWEHASSEYYKEMALWFSGMMGQVTPKTVNNTAKTLEPFIAPNIRKQVTEGLHASVALMPSKVNYVAWFLPIEHSYEPQTRKIFVTGYLSSSLTSSKRSDKKVTYEYKFRMIDGKPVVTAFTSYEGAPRTQLYLMGNKQKIQKEQQLEAQQERNRELEMQRSELESSDMRLLDQNAEFADVTDGTDGSSATPATEIAQ